MPNQINVYRSEKGVVVRIGSIEAILTPDNAQRLALRLRMAAIKLFEE